jgi:predicted GH43/DUF377 family glycosyl hydrolase
MTKLATTLPIVLRADAARTVIRPFSVEDPAAFASPGHPREQRIADRVVALATADVDEALATAVATLEARHRNVRAVLLKRFDDLDGLTMDRGALSEPQRLLIAAYFTEEFSFESAALFNPSIVSHPDQSGIAPGATRFIVSLRGIGEGHISSLTFRTGVWAADGSVTVSPPSRYASGPDIERSSGEAGELLVQLCRESDSDISELVIHPFMPSQGRGIEDVRLVEFTEDDGSVDYRATYTAFNGADVRQGMLRTSDFRNFEMRGVQGELYQGKGMALFPRRINGRFMMLGRQDNENIWLVQSDDIYTWNGGEKFLSPRWPWEFIQIGNCGSPIELDEGWLVLTHGVGAARTYCVGACLLDKDDPTKVLARLASPLLEPSQGHKDGYVPNVVYSCGAMLRGRSLLVPYGVADDHATFATVDIDQLLRAMN